MEPVNKMKQAFLPLFILMSLLISACSPAQEIPIGVSVEIPEAPIVVPNETVEIEPEIEVVEEPVVKMGVDNSSLAERTREARYGTLIDLTQLTPINCEDTIVDLEDQLADELYEEKNVKDDIRDQERQVAKAEQDYQDARTSSDDRDLIREADDLEEEKDELKDLKNERYKIYRKVISIKETLDRVEPRCQAMTKGKYRR